jgi:hypothetical protein
MKIPLWVSVPIAALMATLYLMILTAAIHAFDQDILLTELLR